MILPQVWGFLIAFPLQGVALLCGAVLRTLLVAIDPKSRFIKSTARQIATEGDARHTKASGAPQIQPSSESIASPDQGVKIEPKEIQAVSENTKHLRGNKVRTRGIILIHTNFPPGCSYLCFASVPHTRMPNFG
jgi:hypothetical protein